MKYYYKIIGLFLTLLLCGKTYAQQENTLYFMERVPQSQYLNPASHPDCKWWLSGLLIPSYVVPMFDPPFVHIPMYMDVSTPFGLNDVIIYKNNKPTTTFAYNPESQAAFAKKLSPIINLSSNISLEWLNLGFKQGKNYWNLSVMSKYNYNLSLPKELFVMPFKGNIDSTRETGVFDGLGINTTQYEEASIGFNRQFSRYFRVGLRVKAIFGVANINTANSSLKMKTDWKTDAQVKNSDPNYTPMPVETETKMLINASIPMVDIENDTSNLPNSIKTRSNLSASDIMKLKNFGWGIDFGLMKDWNSELTLYASVIDFGFIHWKSNVHNYDLTGKYTYNGIPINDVDNISIDSVSNDFKDKYKAKYSQNSYRTSLNTKIFFGGNYKLTKKIAIGLLGRIEKYPFNYEYSATYSLNMKPFRWGTFTLSGSYYKKSFLNFGVGYTIRIMAMQWFAVYDNLIGTAISPEKSRYWSMRWGVNLVFGRGKKKMVEKNKPLLNTL